jgi:polysaccharide export outer membrane protein
MLKLSIVAFLVAAATASAQQSRLGAGDLLSIRALHAAEFGERNIRIDESGSIHLAMIGSVLASGKTTGELTAEIERRLNDFVVDPQVAVEVIELRSRPVSIAGAVRKPGIYQLEEPKRLSDILPLAGGLEPDAGSRMIVTHGDGEVETFRISDVMNGVSGKGYLRPRDTVNVPRAQVIYVLGDVRRPGGFPLRDEERLTALQALALAEGSNPTAAIKAARVIHKDAASAAASTDEREIDLRSILAGKTKDFVLEPNDILFVPTSAAKRTSMKIAEAAVQMAVGAVIFRRN